MPGHYKKKKQKKRSQRGGQKKKLCMCRMSKNQMGGRLLSPAQLKLLQRQHPDFRTLPVIKPKMNQRGMGHGCCQCGNGFFSDLGKSLTGAFHDPLRGLAAVATLGASEVVAVPADLFKRTTGIKASKVLDKAAPVISAVAGPEGALGSKLTSKGLSMVGLGSRRKMRKKRK